MLLIIHLSAHSLVHPELLLMTDVLWLELGSDYFLSLSQSAGAFWIWCTVSHFNAVYRFPACVTPTQKWATMGLIVNVTMIFTIVIIISCIGNCVHQPRKRRPDKTKHHHLRSSPASYLSVCSLTFVPAAGCDVARIFLSLLSRWLKQLSEERAT